jgi:stearoyl-CoA desaturase (delta-9 desaturase)
MVGDARRVISPGGSRLHSAADSGYIARVTASSFNWKAGSFFIGYHVLIAITLPFYLLYFPPGATLLWSTFAVFAMCGVTLTTLYHRYYSHRAFELSKPAEVVLLFFATLIAQGSAFEWAFDHRRHHKYTETPDDPHAIVRGFWFAHILWIFEKRPELDHRMIHDLEKSRLLQFQHRHYNALFLATSGFNSLVLGLLSGDWFGALYLGFLLRMCASHHSTFCINSLAHYWGTRPFDPSQTAANNALCSLITFGEGEHNYHHVFPADYRIGSGWHHWDPGKWLIWTLSKVGLASDLKRARPEAIARARERGTAQLAA